MLVLSRKKDEAIRIDTGDAVIYVEVVNVDRGTVKLGIQAPMSVAVDRLEVAKAKESEVAA